MNASFAWSSGFLGKGFTNGPATWSGVSLTSISAGRFCASSAVRVASSSCPVSGRLCACWNPLIDLANTIPFLPSITPDGNPATSSSTCAWKTDPSTGDPGVPGGTHPCPAGFIIAGCPGAGVGVDALATVTTASATAPSPAINIALGVTPLLLIDR